MSVPYRLKFLLIGALAGAAHAGPALESVVVAADGAAGVQRFEGRVEAVKSATLAAQVPGRIVRIAAEAGQTVKAGTTLVELDAREAAGNDAAQQARLAQARAEWERQQRLHAQKFISRAALDQAELAYKAAAANADATRAGLTHARLVAPMSGVVGERLVEVGDLATPGRPLLTVFDPAAMRVVVAVPASLANGFKLEAASGWAVYASDIRLAVTRAEWLPTVDAGSQTATLRLYLAAGSGPKPGSSVSAQLPVAGGGRLTVPAAAVVRRGEVTAVYVLADDSRPRLRQVRLGDTQAGGARVTVEAGLAPGERVALDPARALQAVRAAK